MEARSRKELRKRERREKKEGVHLPSSLMAGGLTAVLFNSSDVPAVKSWTNKWTVQREKRQRCITVGVLIILVLQEKLSSVQCVFCQTV